MKKGRARRKNHNKRVRTVWGGIWLLSALVASAAIYGVVEMRTGKGTGTAGVSVENSGSELESKPEDILTATGEGNHSAPEQEENKPTAWSIQVVDVNDSVEVEIPVQWQEQPDGAATREAIEKKAAEIAGKWDRQPVDSQMESFDKSTGSYLYSKESDGRILDQEQLAESLLKAIKENSRQEQVKASFKTVAPKRTQAQAKQQYQIIGTFVTTTTSNKNRNQNIRLAAEAIDGVVLKPGQEFSFNNATGNRTKDKGYQPAGAYRNGVLIEEPGGGVCQVSTTLYHAIVDSGLKATERNFHSFAPSYIAKGQDAMVSFDGYAGPDLKFVNSETTSVGLRASFSGSQLKLSIVGLPLLDDGTTVSLRSEKIRDLAPPEPVYEENPELAFGEEKVIDQAQPGSVWKTYRQINKDGKVVEETPLNTSTYKAKPAVIQRNTEARPADTTEQESEEQSGGVQDSSAPDSSTPDSQGQKQSGDVQNQAESIQPQLIQPEPVQPEQAQPEIQNKPFTRETAGPAENASGSPMPELTAPGQILTH